MCPLLYTVIHGALHSVCPCNAVQAILCVAAEALTLMNECGEQVIDTVHPHVDREQEADQDLVCKHNDGLNEVERVPRESTGHS